MRVVKSEITGKGKNRFLGIWVYLIVIKYYYQLL